MKLCLEYHLVSRCMMPYFVSAGIQPNSRQGNPRVRSSPDSPLRCLTGQNLKVGYSLTCSFEVIIHYQNGVCQSTPVNLAFGVTKLVRSRIQLIHKAEVRCLTLGIEDGSLSILLCRIYREISVLHKRSEVLKAINVFSLS